jgi:hypothetical protein
MDKLSAYVELLAKRSLPPDVIRPMDLDIFTSGLYGNYVYAKKMNPQLEKTADGEFVLGRAIIEYMKNKEKYSTLEKCEAILADASPTTEAKKHFIRIILHHAARILVLNGIISKEKEKDFVKKL